MIAAAALGALAFMSAVMLVAWLHVARSRNGGWTDVYWTFGTGAAGVACALLPVEGPGWPTPRQGLVALLVGLWAIRLGSYIAVRVARAPEDVRYARLREQWGADFNRRALGFLQIQSLATALLCISILTAARRPQPEGVGPADVVGLGVLALAILGEALADRQMRRFKADPANRGKVADGGLWAWSRHPNYFFEWLGWLAYPIIAIDLSGGYPEGWLALAGPALMYVVLTRLTGVPPLEAAMIRSKGQAYRDYQARTSPFFPRPPKAQPRSSA